MPHLADYPFAVRVPLPTNEELGADNAAYLEGYAHDYKDGRMMMGAGSVGRPMIELAAAIFRVEGVDPKIREFVTLRVCKLVGGVNPWGPNLRMLQNLKATPEEIEGIQNDGPVTGVNDEAALIMTACDEVTLKGAVQDPTLAAMMKRYDAQVVRAYIAVICWYNLFNRYLTSTRVPTESEADIDKKVGSQTQPG